MRADHMIQSKHLTEIERFYFYIMSCRNPLYGDPWKFDAWQLNDLRTLLCGDKEYMLLRCRGGSKTRDGSCFAVFIAYQRNENGDYNQVLWFAASKSQLVRLRQYLRENRYVKNVYGGRAELFNGMKIHLHIMSRKQSASQRADYIFFDEEQDMNVTFYHNSLGIMVGGAKRKIHMGTTWVDTVLEDNFQRLNPRNQVLEHHVDELSWTTEEEELENYAGQPEFVINSQLYCQWVRPGGVVFEHVRQAELTLANIPNHHNLPRFYGIDPNPVAGHSLILLRILPNDTLYVEKEYPLERNSQAFIELLTEISMDKHAFIEFEENSGEELLKFLYAFIDEQEVNMLATFRAERWAYKNKIQRVYRARQFKEIVVHPACKESFYNIRQAIWDDNFSRPRIKKESDHHRLDAFLHAIQFPIARVQEYMRGYQH